MPPNFEFGGTAPAEVQTYLLERDDPDSFPYAWVTEYDLVFDELPADLDAYLVHCLGVACAAGDSVVWLGFEGSFHFDNVLTDAIAPQIYGVGAPGREPVVAPDLETLKTPAWRLIVRSFGSRFQGYSAAGDQRS
ncbi:hypothetical protein ABZ783_20730 [Micromonospora sp. NPDC047738]|uniref:hypothetical protein n=1 Tax=Micromonospora sp. NPDC047738 TaxID=3155741 RepID=UPI0033FB11F9